MSSEAIETIKRYFSSDENIMQFFGDKSEAYEIRDYLCNGEKFPGDIPDMALTLNENCLAIEHFEFDSSQNSKKGSHNKIELARIERKFDQSTSETFLSDTINVSSSYQQYVTNVSMQFENHYKKIEAYKKNLIEKGIAFSDDSIKITFLIEDCSPLGTIAYYDDDNDVKREPITLAKSPEFLTLMRKCPNVDYVIACSSALERKFIWLISQKSLDEYDKNALNYSQMKFCEFTPHVCGFNIEI
ncbi:MAG TPA: hypothetical protein PKI60_01770 [Oscillospiraceae bacterium]|nr:hypothetical protein [Oscillospiraceae bacterium]